MHVHRLRSNLIDDSTTIAPSPSLYGKQVIETLSRQLTEQYGHGYSVPSVKSFRQFFLAFQDRFIEVSSQTVSDLFSPVKKATRSVANSPRASLHN